MPLSANEHRQIVKAIASGDAELAGRAMFEHVMESKARTLKNHPRSPAGVDRQAEPAAQKTTR
jgi:DNA-binding FadR family transcriptional regulator